MSNYKKILIAIDINADYESVIQKALTVCQSMDDVSLVYIPLSSVYIQPYLYGSDYSEIDAADRTARAQNKPDEIENFTNKIHGDLIVIGTHGRSGIKLLLGSTANAVLHGVKQDVLIVRVHDENNWLW